MIRQKSLTLVPHEESLLLVVVLGKVLILFNFCSDLLQLIFNSIAA